MILSALVFLQEAAAAVEAAVAEPSSTIPIQAIAALVLPVVVQLLKLAIPKLEGKALFWANMTLNLVTAGALIFGMDAGALETLGVGVAGGLAGSKAVDVSKRGVLVSERHRRAPK